MNPTSFEEARRVCLDLPFYSTIVTWEPKQIQAYISLLEAETRRAKDALAQRTSTEKFVVQRMDTDTGDWVDIVRRFPDRGAAQKYVTEHVDAAARRIVKRTEEVL